MILAAGIGSRMGSLTSDQPKALLQLNHIPLIEHIIRRLKNAGITEIIINVHHCADQIINFINHKNKFNLRIEFSWEEKLLDTGGGLKKAGWFFDDNKPFILHNVDIISEISLKNMITDHKRFGALATLAVRKRVTARQLLFDDKLQFVGWKSAEKKQQEIIPSADAGKIKEYAFLGIHILSPDILRFMPQSSKFSIINAYLQIAAHHKRIIGSIQKDGYWLDVGRPEYIKTAESFLKELNE